MAVTFEYEESDLTLQGKLSRHKYAKTKNVTVEDFDNSMKKIMTNLLAIETDIEDGADTKLVLTHTVNEVTLGVINNTATTSDVVQITGSGVFTGVDASAFVAITQSGLTSGDAVSITTDGMTTGTALKLDSSGVLVTTGSMLEILADGATTAAGIVRLSCDGLTTGEGVLLDHTTSVIADGGSILRVSSSSVDTGGATNGTVLDVQSSGQLAGTVALVETIVTTGTAVEVNSTGAYTGTSGILAVNGTNATTGDVAVITGGGAGQTTSAGSVLQINNAGATNGSDLEINHSTGIYTGTKGIVDIDADAATTGTIVDINAPGITTGTALNITVAAGSSGPAIKLTGGSGIEHATQMKMISASPSVGGGFGAAEVAQWVPKGRFGGAVDSGAITTEFICDLTGLSSSTTLNDVIGEDGAVDCHFGQITSAIHGTIFSMEIICLETPAGGDADIDFNTLTISTGTEDVDVTGLTGYVQLHANGTTWAVGDHKSVVTALPAANSYLYMSVGAGGTASTYTAGKFKIIFTGI